MPLSESVLVVMALLTLAMLTAAMARNLPIPHTVFLVILGMLLGRFAGESALTAPLAEIRLTPDLVFFVFLPALIFESGFNLNARQLLKDLTPVLMLAVPALLLSAGIVGLGSFALLGLPLLTAMLFGALISATDPVAVVALFKELGAPLRLNVLVEGESLLNDATAIVLFTIVLGLTRSTPEPGVLLVAGAVMDFLRVFIGGALVGLLIALAVVELMVKVRFSNAAVVTMSLVMAYLSFIIAEHSLHVSGVMATASAAVTLAGYGVTRLPAESPHSLGEVWEFIALIANSLLFILVGLSVDVSSLAADLPPIAIAIALVMVARASGVYTLVPLTARLFKLPAVSSGYRHIMWWGGLKGGLAIAIVLSIPAEIPGRETLLNLTVGVVLFTLLVNAPTIRPLMRRLGMDALDRDERAEFSEALDTGRDTGGNAVRHLAEFGVVSDSSAQDANQRIYDTFTMPTELAEAPHTDRALYLMALQAELHALQRIHAYGAIAQYTYLDIKANLLRDRERGSGAGSRSDDTQPPTRNIFLGIERGILHRLREFDLATGLLSRYQALRLGQHLQHNIAGIMLAQAALAMLDAHRELNPEAADELSQAYADRLQRRKIRVATIEKEFPEYFKDFTTRFAARIAFGEVSAGIDHDFQHGAMGAKVWTRLHRAISAALACLPHASPRLPRLTYRDLIHGVPLFAGLDEDALSALVVHAHNVTFVPGDVVIGEQEKGDALYILRQGRVRIEKANDEEVEVLAELGPGEFVGEMALLDEAPRAATVRATTPCTLVRLTRRDVLTLAERQPQVAKRLEQAKRERQGDAAT